MNLIVLDASVIVKWVKPENEDKVSESNQYLIDHTQGIVQVHSPTIVYYELHNTIACLTRDIRPPKLVKSKTSFCQTSLSFFLPYCIFWPT